MIPLRARVLLVLALLALGGAGSAGAQGSRLTISVGSAAAEWRPFVRVNGLLAEDRALRDALASGLPLRFRFRLELWEKGVLDRLVGTDEVLLAVLQDPLDRTFLLTNGTTNGTYSSISDVERALGREVPHSVRPNPRGGRYYYLATLEVETLSLSDLDELRRWLRGEARPAVEGRRSVGGALGQGLQRAFVRMVRLPTRRYEARTPTFSVG